MEKNYKLQEGNTHAGSPLVKPTVCRVSSKKKKTRQLAQVSVYKTPKLAIMFPS